MCKSIILTILKWWLSTLHELNKCSVSIEWIVFTRSRVKKSSRSRIIEYIDFLLQTIHALFLHSYELASIRFIDWLKFELNCFGSEPFKSQKLNYNPLFHYESKYTTNVKDVSIGFTSSIRLRMSRKDEQVKVYTSGYMQLSYDYQCYNQTKRYNSYRELIDSPVMFILMFIFVFIFVFIFMLLFMLMLMLMLMQLSMKVKMKMSM
jgi:ATP-dependent Zn protease